MLPARPSQRFWARAEAWARRLENALLAILFFALLALATSQIVLRNFFSAGLPWADGLVRILVLWLALIGAIAASRDHKHIAIDVVLRSLPPLLRRLAVSVACLFTAVVSGFFAWHSARFVLDSREFGEVLVADWPAWILQLILPIGFALIASCYLLRLVSSLRGTS